MQYLQNKQYYIDSYDIHTIEECLKYYWAIKDGFEKKRLSKEFKKYTKEEFNNQVHKAASYTVNAVKGERYRHKAETISKWTESDRQMQEKYDNTIPSVVHCTECFSETTIFSKTLHDAYGKNARMLFMYECTKCKKRQALFEDGTKWNYQPPMCPKCNTPLKSKSTYKNEVDTTVNTCPKCKYTQKEIYDFKKSRIEREQKEARDKKLLIDYRNDFCYSDKDGQEAVQSLDNLVRAVDDWKEREKKVADPVYQKAMKLKKLTIIEVEKLITKAAEKEKYVKLMLDKLEIGKQVIVGFTIQDEDPKRREYDSKNILQKLIKKALEKTNWRLTSEGVNYRLGYLTGRLKGLENEDDLIDIYKHK